MIRLRVCAGWSDPLLVAHTALLEISCRGSNISFKSWWRVSQHDMTTNKTRGRSRLGAIANPNAKVFDSPSTPKFHPGAWPWQQNENSVQYVFYLLFVRTHTKFGIKIFEIDMLMIFDPLTLGWNCYLHFVLLVILVDLICYMTMFEKKKCLTPWVPQMPQSPNPGAWPRRQNKNPVWYVCIFHLWEHKHNLVLKSLKLTW